MSKVAVERIEEFTTGNLEETAATIKASGKTFKMMVRNIYLNPILAPVREITHNHLDEHKRTKLDQPIQITVPTYFDPTWKSRDYGESMSHEFMMSPTSGFMTLGESRKEGDHTQAGFWGIGSKTPLAYTDQFTVKCFKKHHYRTYLIKFKTFDLPDGSYDTRPVITFIDEGLTTEPDGTEVSWAVNTRDISRFESELTKVLAGLFDMDPLPVIMKNGAPVASYDPDLKILQQGPGWRLFATNDILSRAHVRVSNILYPLDGSALPRLKMEAKPLLETPLIIDFGTADLHIQPSRDGLEYSDKTVTAVEARLHDLLAYLVKDVQTEIAAQPTRWDATRLLQQKLEGQTRVMADIYRANVRYKDEKLPPHGRFSLPPFFKSPCTVKARITARQDILIMRPMSHLQLGRASPIEAALPLVVYIEDASDRKTRFQSERIRHDVPGLEDRTQILWLRADPADPLLGLVLDHYGLPDSQVRWANKLPLPPSLVPVTGKVKAPRVSVVQGYEPHKHGSTVRMGKVLSTDPTPRVYLPVAGDLTTVCPSGHKIRGKWDIAQLFRRYQAVTGDQRPLIALRPKEQAKVPHWTNIFDAMRSWADAQPTPTAEVQKKLDYEALTQNRFVRWLKANQDLFKTHPDLVALIRKACTAQAPDTTKTEVADKLRDLSTYITLNLSTPTQANKSVTAEIEALETKYPVLKYISERSYYSSSMSNSEIELVNHYLTLIS